MVDDEGHVTGLTGFTDMQTEAFGISIAVFCEGSFGPRKEGMGMGMGKGKGGLVDPYEMDAGNGYGEGKSVRKVLEERFWDVLWSEIRELVGFAFEVGVVKREFGGIVKKLVKEKVRVDDGVLRRRLRGRRNG